MVIDDLDTPESYEVDAETYDKYNLKDVYAFRMLRYCFLLWYPVYRPSVFHISSAVYVTQVTQHESNKKSTKWWSTFCFVPRLIVCRVQCGHTAELVQQLCDRRRGGPLNNEAPTYSIDQENNIVLTPKKPLEEVLKEEKSSWVIYLNGSKHFLGLVRWEIVLTSATTTDTILQKNHSLFSLGASRVHEFTSKPNCFKTSTTLAFTSATYNTTKCTRMGRKQIAE